MMQRQQANFNRDLYSNLHDLSSDLGVGISLILWAICCVLYGYEHPYRQVYVLGAVALTFHIHRIARWFGI